MKTQKKCVIYARFSPRPAEAVADCQSNKKGGVALFYALFYSFFECNRAEPTLVIRSDSDQVFSADAQHISGFLSRIMSLIRHKGD